VGAESYGEDAGNFARGFVAGGWTLQSGTGKFTVAAKQSAALRIEVLLPAVPESESRKPEAQEISVHADSNGQSIGEIKLRVEVRKHTLPHKPLQDFSDARLPSVPTQPRATSADH